MSLREIEQKPPHFPQSPDTVVMVRPHHFTPNAETAADNAFQSTPHAQNADHLSKRAFEEASRAVDILESHGVKVCLFEDDTQNTPDSVFPNNWFSTHADGTLVLYPMYAPNRRKERRKDIIEFLHENFHVNQTIDLTQNEAQGRFLEGTGSIIIDHPNSIAYAALSNRTDESLFAEWCETLRLNPIVFEAKDANATPIYHTNVMMCVGTDFAMIGLETVSDEGERQTLIDSLQASGKEIVALSMAQIVHFAGNAFELEGKNGRVLALSATAFEALNPLQIKVLETYVEFVPIPIPTIEMAGGSVRCMLAGIHLPPKNSPISEESREKKNNVAPKTEPDSGDRVRCQKMGKGPHFSANAPPMQGPSATRGLGAMEA